MLLLRQRMAGTFDAISESLLQLPPPPLQHLIS